MPIGHVFVALAVSQSYPAAPDEADKLCEAIGETPTIAVPPRDRLWFKESCVCAGPAGCGHIRSDRFQRRIAAAKRAADKAVADQRTAEEKRKAAARAHAEKIRPGRERTAALRVAFWRCDDAARHGFVDCDSEAKALEAECERYGLRASRWGHRTDDCFREDPKERVRAARAELASLRKAYWSCAGDPAKSSCEVARDAVKAVCLDLSLRVMKPGSPDDECFGSE